MDFCPICGAETLLRTMRQPGYVEGSSFLIHFCQGCDCAYAIPTEVNEDLYETIYANTPSIPGYAQYWEYANKVLQMENPIRYLIEQQDVYWGVYQALLRIDGSRGMRILEVGSGLGYLTYALARSGFNIRGIDLSESAVDQARSRYGDLFFTWSIDVFSHHLCEAYDIIIMAELIEHLPDIKGTIAKVRTLLRPGGTLVLTTPNKSIYPQEALWETEPPPVHLWWFSEESIQAMGRSFGFTVEFVDFTPFNLKHFHELRITSTNPSVTRRPRLSGFNVPIKVESRVWKNLKKMTAPIGIYSLLKRLRCEVKPGYKRLVGQSAALCALMVRTE